jgi:hypothetical protein
LRESDCLDALKIQLTVAMYINIFTFSFFSHDGAELCPNPPFSYYLALAGKEANMARETDPKKVGRGIEGNDMLLLRFTKRLTYATLDRGFYGKKDKETGWFKWK